MKALLCLLSVQHVPNLLSVHHFQPDHLVLIQSSGMQRRNAAGKFTKALRLGRLDYDGQCDIERLDKEDDLDAVRDVLRRAYGKHATASWIANITGGTKPMSLAAYEFFKATAGQIIYTNVSRPSELMNLVSGEKHECSYKLGIEEFLAGYGFESRKKDKKIRDAEERARTWANCARLIARHLTSDDLLQLSRDDHQTARNQGWTIEPGELVIPHDSTAQALVAAFNLTALDDGRTLTGEIDKYQADFLTGGWLEVFLWNLLNEHQDSLGIWDVRLGLQIGPVSKSPDNECDVSFMRNWGLSILECKSGAQEHDPGGDVLYKIESVIRQFQALRVNSYLATTGRNVLDQDGNLKSSVDNRASIYNCRILTANDIRELATDDVSPDTIAKKMKWQTDG